MHNPEDRRPYLAAAMSMGEHGMAEMKVGSQRVLTASAGEGRWRVEGTAIATGAGVTLHLSGGDRPHVGAAAMGIPRPSLQDPARTSATVSVLAVTGHKDDELARPLAELAARRLGQVAVVVVGVHIDDATAEEIARLGENARQAAQRLLQQLTAPL